MSVYMNTDISIVFRMEMLKLLLEYKVVYSPIGLFSVSVNWRW